MIKSFFSLINRSSLARAFFSRVMFPNMTGAVNGSPVLFLSYGYVDDSLEAVRPALQTIDEPDRICIQLYHHVVSPVRLDGLDILEVSCGHGGGTSYIMRYLNPRSMLGVDRNPRAIRFCRTQYAIPGLTFSVGNAEKLPAEDNAFDAVVNVEASHFYNMEQFLKEVVRVLRPGGHLLFADLRNAEESAELHAHFVRSGLEIVKQEDISANVLKAMSASTAAREAVTRRLAPKAVTYFVRQFTGVKGSQLYNNIESGKMVYLGYTLRKPDDQV